MCLKLFSPVKNLQIPQITHHRVRLSMGGQCASSECRQSTRPTDTEPGLYSLSSTIYSLSSNRISTGDNGGLLTIQACLRDR